MTVVVQIGNSNNKLSQKDWSCFVSEIDDLIKDYKVQIHFRGGSSWDSPW